MSLLSPNAKISIEPLKCLRTEYLYNECSSCIEACPNDALAISHSKRIAMDSSLCINCNACIGICPTSTFSNSEFDQVLFILKSGLDKDLVLSCKQLGQCLSVFGVENLISLGLREKSVTLDMSHCHFCDVINCNGKVEAQIRETINNANRFLAPIGMSQIITQEIKSEISRRDAIFSFATEARVLNDNSSEFDKLFDPKDALPKSRLVLQNSLKYSIENFTTNTIEDKFDFLSNKKIDFDSCTNCGDCLQFCPTNALFYGGDKTKILFQTTRCISCGICEDICKPKSISSVDNFDMVSLAFGRAEVLIENHFVTCTECRVDFPQKHWELICGRCIDFANNNQKLFTLARDM